MTLNSRVISGCPDALSRIVVGGLVLAFAVRLLDDYLRTHRTIDLLMLIGEIVVVVLIWLRRPATVVDGSAIARFVTTLSMISPLLMRPAHNPALLPEAQAMLLASIGLVIVVAGKISLGRSFGLLPANRGVMRWGLYRFVRHPIYLGYLLTHIPFLASHPSAWNVTVLVAGDIALIVRAFYEERTLLRDPQYARYCETVKWRLVPGVC
jgi:protein-S-isoprenylcysteine O-methyltransferase Ste14